MKKSTIKALAASAAFAGLLAGTAVRVQASDFSSTSAVAHPHKHKKAKAKIEKHACKGQNSCKGQGGCKSGDNGCKGKNSCKGKGGCATDGSKMPA